MSRAVSALSRASLTWSSGLSESEAAEIAFDACVYAYPLVISELTRRISVGAPGGTPMSQFRHMRAFPDADFNEVVRPNADTLYSSLWFDVSQEPLVITVPDSGDRYYLLPMLDMWSDVFAVPGTRTTGNRAQRLVLARDGWQGELPTGSTLIRSPTAQGWIIGRTQTAGPADYPNVHQFQSGLSATPLSHSGHSWHAPRAEVDPSWDLRTAPVAQMETLSAAAYFTLFADLMRLNPPHANDYPLVHRLARLGLEAGKPVSLASAPAQMRQAIETAWPAALGHIKAGVRGLGVNRNGWRISFSGLGTYGTDYRTRAAIAYGGFGANVSEDAVYPSAVSDAEGRPFASDQSYVLHFERAQIPPVRAFWSLTMYNDQQLFAANPLERFAIGDRDALQFNDDGSLDLYIQRHSPGAKREANWLPTPASGGFSINLRLYWPRPEVLDGTWSPPPVRRVS
jgi:hypothetical protein